MHKTSSTKLFLITSNAVTALVFMPSFFGMLCRTMERGKYQLKWGLFSWKKLWMLLWNSVVIDFLQMKASFYHVCKEMVSCHALKDFGIMLCSCQKILNCISFKRSYLLVGFALDSMFLTCMYVVWRGHSTNPHHLSSLCEALELSMNILYKHVFVWAIHCLR